LQHNHLQSGHLRWPSDVGYVPFATDWLRSAPQQTAPLFDHLVGAGEQRWRHSQSERLGSLEFGLRAVEDD
jgi:hypothetical protein